MNQPVGRPPSAEDKRRLVKPVTDGLFDLVFGSPGLFDDRPAFIAQPSGSNPFVNAVRTLTQYNCRVWASRDKNLYSTAVNVGNADLCGPYLDSIGEEPLPGGLLPPFAGGQCGCSLYKVEFRVEGTSDTFGGPFLIETIQRSRGPISGPFRATPTEFRYTHRGTRGFETGNIPPCGPPGQLVNLAIGFPSSDARVTLFNVTPLSGPDDCGDPPDSLVPPSTVTPQTPLPPEVIIDIPGFGDLPFTVGPGPDGGIEVCSPELDFCVTIGPDDGAPGAGPGPETPPSPGPNVNGPGDSGAVGAASPEGQDGSFGPPPEGRAWVGAFVEFIVPARLGVIPSANSANPAFATVVGNVSLDHGGVFSEATQVRSRWASAFRRDPNLTVAGIRVNTRPGVSFRVYRVSVETCPENICPVPT